jgi:hypothetical protein
VSWKAVSLPPGSELRAGGLGQRVRQHPAPGEALERRQGDGDRGVEVRAADAARHVHAERDAETPGPGDAVELAGSRGGHLGDDAHAEQDENRGAGELGGQLADESVAPQPLRHGSSKAVGMAPLPSGKAECRSVTLRCRTSPFGEP